MSFLLKWYLRYRYPKFQRAYRLVFDPEGFHHYPKELKEQVEGKSKDDTLDALRKTLKPYMVAGKDAQTQNTLTMLAELTPALPQILEMTIQLANWPSLASKDKKHFIAVVAYLVSPVDIIPEGVYGGAGFADDLLFASIAYRTVITDTSEKFVSAFWKGEKKLFETFCALEGAAKESLPELHSEVTKAFQTVFA